MAETKLIRLITLKNPCSACLILCNLTKELLKKLQKCNGQIAVEFVELDHINQAYLVEGLEVDKFPAIIIDGEQVTAGSLPGRELLGSLGLMRVR
ncbi:MAG: thioredoxin family protein [Christensenellales bacterium]